MRAYFINLASRPDRNAAMQVRLSALGLVADRIEAMTPADLTPEQRSRYCNRLAYRWQSEGELACSLSHLAALRQFLATPAPWGLVLEDDAVLSSSLPALLAIVEAEHPAIDILRLETDDGRLRLPANSAGTLGSHALFRLFGAGGGAAAYIVNRRAARRIVMGEDVLSHLTDQALFNPHGAISRDLVVRQIDPALAIQEDRLAAIGTRLASSDLERLRQQRQAINDDNFWRRAAYNFRDLVGRDIVLAGRNLYAALRHGVTKRQIPFKAD